MTLPRPPAQNLGVVTPPTPRIDAYGHMVRMAGLVWTAVSKCCVSAVAIPFIWNGLFPLLLRNKLMSGISSQGVSFSPGLLHWKRGFKRLCENHSIKQGFFVMVRAGTAYRHLFSQVKKFFIR